ncbi:MAG: MCP four helix bundle domain-containing protein [Nitrospirae bacterium]|nr:MCP four helix bundle domain-containing protein [Nitrospirota bacterium]MBF0593090.1 MCP four helix bundle domain-containing protein [Nitrospirota bacterium]
MKIRLKLCLVFGIVLLLLLIVGAIGYMGMSSMGDATSVMLDTDAHFAEYSIKLKVNTLELRRNEKDIYINIGSPEKRDEYLKKWNEQKEKAVEKISALEKIATEAKDKDSIASIKADLAAYDTGFNKVYTMIKEDKIKTTQEANSAIGEYKDPIHKMEGTAGELSEVASQRMHDVGEKLNAIKKRSQHTMLIILLISIIAVIASSCMITRSITRPIAIAMDVSNTIAGGDLTVDIDVTSKDEVGQLMASLKGMVDKLKAVVSEVNTVVESVAEGSGEISSGTQQLSDAATQQAAAVEEASSSMEQMTSNIKQSADNAQQTERIAVKAANDAREGGSAVTEAIHAMKQIAEKISIIDEIARQTNLLALNAAIEAARAGEHGKGFAVVASEVRKLAERSQKAAGEISHLSISSVQTAEKAGNMLQNLVPDIQRTSELVQEVSASSNEQSIGADQINKAIQNLDQTIQQNAASSEEIASTSQVLSEHAEQLRTTMGFFKTGERVGSLPRTKAKHHVPVITHERRPIIKKAPVRQIASTPRPVAKAAPVTNFDFSNARSKHLLWKTKLRDFLDGKESLTEAQAVSHKDCDLGKWLYSKGLDSFGHMDEMMNLEHIHEDLHTIVKEIIKLKHSGDTSGAEEKYAKIGPLSKEIIALLTEIERKVA